MNQKYQLDIIFYQKLSVKSKIETFFLFNNKQVHRPKKKTNFKIKPISISTTNTCCIK